MTHRSGMRFQISQCSCMGSSAACSRGRGVRYSALQWLISFQRHTSFRVCRIPPMDKEAQTAHARTIRSFVTRAGRLTDAQERALNELWPKYGVDFEPEVLDFDALFGRRAPRVVEIGFGNGDHL